MTFIFPEILSNLDGILFSYNVLSQFQGDMVDNIEKNVDSTQIHVEEGAKNVKSAVEYKKSALRKKVIFKKTIMGGVKAMKIADLPHILNISILTLLIFGKHFKLICNLQQIFISTWVKFINEWSLLKKTF